MNRQYLHLYLGLTRSELKRRLELGLIDSKAIEYQISDYNLDIKLNALTEQWLSDHKREQIENDEVQIEIDREIKTDKVPDIQ